MVVTIQPNSNYIVRELDGTIHCVPYAGKRVKIFKRRVYFEGDEILDSDVENEDEDFAEDFED